MSLDPLLGRTRGPRPAPRRSTTPPRPGTEVAAPSGERAPYQPSERELPPALYLYRIGSTAAEVPGQIAGIVGMLPAGEAADRLRPHEALLPRDAREPRSSTMERIAPIMVLAPPGTLLDLLEPEGPPVVAMRIGDTHHRLYPLTSPVRVATVREALADVPLVIADGHHRAVAVSRSGRAVPVFIVPADHPDLRVEPIGRRLPRSVDRDLVQAASDRFDIEPGPPGSPPAPGEIVVRTSDGALHRLRPRPRTLAALPAPLRTVAAAVAERALWPALTIDPTAVVPGEDPGRGPYAWMGPVPVETVIDAALAGELFPAKTTRFLPKPHPDVVAG